MSKGNSKNAKDTKTYPLNLGRSFDKRPEVSYHTLRCKLPCSHRCDQLKHTSLSVDFKPVSLGSSKDLTMQIGGENGLEVTATMAAGGKQVYSHCFATRRQL